jgi:hypothetical protein
MLIVVDQWSYIRRLLARACDRMYYAHEWAELARLEACYDVALKREMSPDNRYI